MIALLITFFLFFILHFHNIFLRAVKMQRNCFLILPNCHIWNCAIYNYMSALQKITGL